MARLPYKEVAQMRKFLALAALLALSVTYQPAHADTYRAWKSIGVRHLRAALPNGGVQDSSFSSHTGAVTDTLIPFTIDGWAYTPYVLGADSLQTFDFMAYVGNGTTVTGAVDDLGATLTLDGSFDGVTWDPGVAAVVAEDTNGAGLAVFKGYHSTRLGMQTAAQTTNLQMGIYPYYRLRVAWASGTVGVIKYLISWWRVGVSPNW